MDDTAKLNKLNGLFSALVDMYKELTDSQVEERKYVKEKLAEYQEFYNIDVRELQDEIDDLKSKLVIADLDLKREKSKSILLMSIKESRHGRDKFRLGFVESTIKALLDFIEHSCGEKEKSEVSRLLSDVGSTYTQNMESEDTSFQRSKCMEVEDADEKVDKLKPSMEQLLSLNTEKDETILKLEDDIGSKRVEVEQANEKLENLQTSMEELQSTMREKDELIVILQGQAEKVDPILLDMEEWILLHKEKEETILKLEDDIGCKCIEVEQANEKIEKLRTSMEQLQSSISEKNKTIVILKGEVEQTNKKLDKLATSMQHLESSNTRKDETIVKLKADLAKFEEETNKSKREPSKLSEKVDILRKSEGASLMPVLNLCNGPLTCSTARQKRSMEIPTNKSKREPSKLSEKVEILRKSEGASLMPVLNSCNGPLTRSMARQKRSMEIPTTSHALDGVSLAPVMMSCITKPCTQVRRPRRSQVTRPVSKIESLGSQVFGIGKTEMKESITGKRKPDENNSILGQQPRTRKKHCSSL